MLVYVKSFLCLVDQLSLTKHCNNSLKQSVGPSENVNNFI